MLGEASQRAGYAGIGFSVVVTSRTTRRALDATGVDQVQLLHGTVPHGSRPCTRRPQHSDLTR